MAVVVEFEGIGREVRLEIADLRTGVPVAQTSSRLLRSQRFGDFQRGGRE